MGSSRVLAIDSLSLTEAARHIEVSGLASGCCGRAMTPRPTRCRLIEAGSGFGMPGRITARRYLGCNNDRPSDQTIIVSQVDRSAMAILAAGRVPLG